MKKVAPSNTNLCQVTQNAMRHMSRDSRGTVTLRNKRVFNLTSSSLRWHRATNRNSEQPKSTQVSTNPDYSLISIDQTDQYTHQHHSLG